MTVAQYNKLITDFVPAHINHRTGEPHEHKREIERRRGRSL